MFKLFSMGMKFLSVSLIFVSAQALFAADEKNMSSVVKIFSVFSRPNYYQPWQNFQQQTGTGSGCVISENRILTNAHIIANQTFIMVRRQGDPKKYVARLLAAGHDCDLALLSVDDVAFYKGITPTEFGELPHLQDTVTALGYPSGGDNISITEGVVSRIEPTVYMHSGRILLSVQIDAAINPGNSGGPVLKDGKMIGIAFQNASQRENMGYMIPVPVIKHFLKDVADNSVDGFPDINMRISEMENPDMRKWALMPPEQTGVMITYLSPLEEARNIFRVNDVLLSIDGINIANDGTVPFRETEVIFFGNLIWEKYVGDKCRFKLLRNGKEMELEYTLERKKKLVPERVFGQLPSYYIIGGLLFVPLNQNYLDSWGGQWWNSAPRELVNYASEGEITDERSQIVVLSGIFADDINVGYQSIKYQAVEKVNGKTPRDLKDLVNTIENMKEGFLEISLKSHSRIVLDIARLRKADPAILKRYRIPSCASADLLAK
ncbi:MAG: hypothetical protein A2017_19280 [Lentisphaerae bacterium GWF2_44_16]|nr:MAG: hypothetical protein A2017_19280 [Lentisphaerae bacterium GWF2_44_16]